MYGLLLESIQYYLREKYGEDKWRQIREFSGISDHVFITHKQYGESFMGKIADASEQVLGEECNMTRNDFMQFFGSCFVRFFSHYGYDVIISVSGRHLRDFLIGIDNLHEHIRFGYPKLQSPSFFCEDESSSGLTLHYTSRRKGLMFYVVGQIKEIASSFYHLDVDIKILRNDVDDSASSTHVVYRLGFDNSGYKPVGPDLLSLQQTRSINAEIFFNIFPFSFVLSQDMTISMAGNGLVSTVGPQVIGNDVRELFAMRRPKAEFTWKTLTTRHVIFELICSLHPPRRPAAGVDFRANESRMEFEGNENPCALCAAAENPSGNSGVSRSSSKTPRLHLRGQMKFMKTWGKTIYICSPMIGDVEEMLGIGLYMNDLGLHDTSREMVLSGIKPLPQLEMAIDHEFDKGKALEENMKKLALERKRSDDLLYRLIPKPIADRLMLGEKAVKTCEHFESVTVMFSYLDGFVSICSQVSAMEVVNLVNNMFTTFDKLTEKHNVYKFETLGDALYMAVSGAPVKMVRHAEPMSAMALDMLEAVKVIKSPANNKPMTVTVGLHCGPVAAGLVGEKTPQYCLFGDTVNIASRLRTAALPMRIHISEACKQCLDETEFLTEYRGLVELKGKGKMRTHWLIGRKPS